MEEYQSMTFENDGSQHALVSYSADLNLQLFPRQSHE
jgi:hypothetical protein